MARFLARRLGFAAVLVLTVSSAAFLLTRLAPGDYATDVLGFGASAETVARTRARYALDRPVLIQYADWIARVARLDLGTSMMFGRPVGELVGGRALNSAVLGLTALAAATLVGYPLGVASAVARSGPLPWLVRALSMLALSLPPLLTSLALVYLAARTGWFPLGGMTSVDAMHASWSAWTADLIRHLPLPALALALPIAALIERLQSQAVADAMRAPHVVAALARGVPRRRIIWRHVLPIASGPVVSVYGLIVGSLLSGSFVVEIIAAWPGLGRLMFDALRARDVYLVAGCAMAGALFVATANLLADLTLGRLDPRVRETAEAG